MTHAASIVDDVAVKDARLAIDKNARAAGEFLPLPDRASLEHPFGDDTNAPSADFLRDLKELLKPRISSMVLVTVP